MESATENDNGESRSPSLSKVHLRYLQWLSEKGVSCSHAFSVKEGEYGMGVFFENTPSSRCTVRFSIPHELLLHPQYQPTMAAIEDAISPTSARFFQENLEGRLDYHLISIYLFLVREKNDEASSWKPYIDILPKQYDSTIFWTPEELELVKGTNIYAGTLRHLTLLELVLQWGNLVQADCKLPPISQEDLLWAYSAVHSRDIGVNLDSNINNYVVPAPDPTRVIPCLVPLGDTFNHHPEVPVKFMTDNDAGCFCFETEFDPKRGSEIFSNYGPKTNEAFLFSYGFTLTPNVNSTFWVQLGLSEQVPLWWIKQELFMANKLSLRHHILNDGSIPSSLILSLGILVMDEEQLSLVSDDVELSSRCKSSVLQSLTRMLSHKLALLPPSAENNYAKYSRGYDALLYLNEQRTILDAAMLQITKLLTELSDTTPIVPSLPSTFQAPSPNLDFLTGWTQTISSSTLTLSSSPQLCLKQTDARPVTFNSEFVISSNSVQVSLQFKPYLENILSLFPNGMPAERLICIYIMQLCETRNAWSEYFCNALLPPNALAWTEDDFERLDATPLNSLGRSLRNEFHDFFFGDIQPLSRKYPDMFPIAHYSRERASRTFSLVLQNSFSVGVPNGGEPLSIFVPLPLPPSYNPASMTELSLSGCHDLVLSRGAAQGDTLSTSFATPSFLEESVSHYLQLVAYNGLVLPSSELAIPIIVDEGDIFLDEELDPETEERVWLHPKSLGHVLAQVSTENLSAFVNSHLTHSISLSGQSWTSPSLADYVQSRIQALRSLQSCLEKLSDGGVAK